MKWPYRMLLGTMGVVWFLWVTLAWSQQRAYFLPGPRVQTYAVILTGPSPGQDYRNQLRSWSLQLYDILIKDYGYDPEHIILLMDDPGSKDKRISGPSRRDILQEKIETLQKRLQPGDQLLFFLMGHGTSNDVEAKFVLTGPDISGGSFAELLATFSAQDIVIVNAASASFPFCTELAGPGRVIVSATRSSAEKYDTIFAQHFIAALDDHRGDRDKNQRVSIWEAFIYATGKVEQWYADQNRIPTEHAVLDDNADGIFSPDPAPGKEDGLLAQIAYIDPLLPTPSANTSLSAEEKTLQHTLHATIRDLERSVFLLRGNKSELPADTYQTQLEELLVELARTSRQLRQLGSTRKP